MGHKDSVRVLASLFRASNEARPLILLGAGASFSSGVPLAAESVRRIARRVFAEKAKGGAILPEQVKLTEWQSWLHAQPWFISEQDRLAENFPLVVEHLLQPRQYRARILRELFQPSSGIGSGYKCLAGLVMKGLARTVLTTNFDTCLPIALNERRPHIPHIAEVNRGPDDLREFNLFNRAQIVWLHGKAEQYTDRNLAGELEKLDEKLVNLIIPMLSDSPLVVIGYRGAEPSVTNHLLAENANRTLNFKNGIFWCVKSGDPIHPNIEMLRKVIGGNLRPMEISGFDELMADLAIELADEDLYQTVRTSEQNKHPFAFDDSEVAGASVSDLDHDLMLAVLREYCVKLGRPPVTRETLPGLLREQGLLIQVNNAERPTAGCVLLFGKNPQAFFPHSIVAATIAGKKRSLFAGNLIQQRTQLLEWLESDNVNPILRVKRRTKHNDEPAYPARALIELLINMLVHRDYAREDVARIDVEPGKSIVFTNPGGLLESVVRQVKPDAIGRFHPVANVSELRNRSLCDVFFGIQAMERDGTGLVDVEELARGGGGDTAFTHDAKARIFSARILQPVASAGSVTTARDERAIGTYIFNVLPFASLPNDVSVVRLRVPLSDRPKDMPIDEAGTFIHTGETIWSFAPLPVLTSVFASIVDANESASVSRASIESDAEKRKTLSWLLRKHFERHLFSLKKHGLMLEEGKKRDRRAYFEGRDGKSRMLIYDTPRRKAVQREVVKQRGEESRIWFENEGFAYEIVQLDGIWAVRIKPFYMFTGRDAKKPLPSFARTSRAARRIKLDRNKNVEDDLTFWGRFLSGGSPTINIGQSYVDDLILDAQFLMVEVPETGLLRESDEGEDRMPA